MEMLADRVRRGDVTRGLWQVLPGAVLAELAAECGFDWLVLDGEHGPWDPAGLRDRLIGVRAAGADAIIRVPRNDASFIGQALDLGAQTVLVPMVDDAPQAEAAVAAARYPPSGRRGNGAFVARASRWGNAMPPPDASVWVQAESRAALRNIDAIASVDGVDCVFLGPADLAGDMGADPGGPAVMDALDGAIDRIRAAGCAAGIYASDPHRWIERGATVVSMGADATALTRALRGLSAR